MPAAPGAGMVSLARRGVKPILSLQGGLITKLVDPPRHRPADQLTSWPVRPMFDQCEVHHLEPRPPLALSELRSC
jgi:hypothetical protein